MCYFSLDGLGYSPADGAATSGSSFRKDINGKIINPGLGPTWTSHRLGAGAGHGGGGGRPYSK